MSTNGTSTIVLDPMRTAVDPERSPSIDPPRSAPIPVAAASAAPSPVPARRPRRKSALLLLVAGILIVALLIGVRWFLNAQHYESTDDAFLDGDVVHVAPQVAGRVLKVLVSDNQLVSKGTLILQIDPRDYELRVADARAELAQAQGKLAESQTQLNVTIADADQSDAMVAVARASAQNAAADLARYDALSERAVSKQTHDSAAAAATGSAAQLSASQKKAASSRAQVEFVKAQIQTQLASVQHSQAALDEALLDLSYTDVRADADGRVTRKNVEPGNYLQIGQQVLALVPQNVWVTANFKETQLEDMRPGSPADIYVDAYPHHTFHGKVDSIQFGTGSAFSLLPPENATGNYVKVVQRVPVKIVFDSEADPNFVLAPGMSAEPEVKVR